MVGVYSFIFASFIVTIVMLRLQRENYSYFADIFYSYTEWMVRYILSNHCEDHVYFFCSIHSFTHVSARNLAQHVIYLFFRRFGLRRQHSFSFYTMWTYLCTTCCCMNCLPLLCQSHSTDLSPVLSKYFSLLVLYDAIRFTFSFFVESFSIRI